MDLPFGFDKGNRRVDNRSDCALAIRWKSGEGSELGYVSNLSPDGFCLRTRRLLAPGFAGRFTISRDAGDVEVMATVVWVRQLQVESHIAAWHEMGMRLSTPISSDYGALLAAVANPVEERRTNRRFSHNLLVIITSGSRIFRTQSVDVSKGGVLFLSDELPEMGAQIAIEMHLPGTSNPIHVRAEVVRLVEICEESGVRGFAVRLLGLGNGEERMFINYLKIAKELRGLASSV
jgi:hypothetical protein